MYHLGIYSQADMINKTMEQDLMQKYEIKVHRYLSENDLKNELRYYGYQFDILIFDTQRDMVELKLAKLILEKNQYIRMIFVIDDIENISDVFEVEPVYVLYRSFREEQFFAAIGKAMEKIHDTEEGLLQIGYKGRLIRIPFEEIIYVESDKRYLILHTEHDDQRILMKLSEVLELLPQYFVRCHQSFIINLNKIRSYERNEVILVSGQKITISRSREEDTKRKVYKYLIKNRLCKGERETI